MRSAASDLRRDNPAAAAASGRRAAEQLRQLEQQDRTGRAGSGTDGASPEARQLTGQLDQARGIRERVQRAEQQLRAAEARGRDGAGRSGTPKGGQSAQAGREGQGNAPAPKGRGEAAGGGIAAGSEVQRLRDEYRREVQRAQQALDRLAGSQPRSGANGSTPEEEQFSHSAPGTEAFKQDRSGWESLREHLDSALEQYEASISDRLARTRSGDRFSLGGSDQVPDAYRQVIAKYFESLAKKKP
jgi:hypothetical protein